MYHAHFALRDEPFGVSPDGRFFLETEQHREALATLYYGIRERRGFALLLGGAGLGKTSVLVQLLKRLEGEAEIAYLPHPFFDSSTVLESILSALGVDSTPSQAQNHRLFYEYLVKTRRAGKTCVVVFDEAQNLNRDTLEAIRMLSNFETPTEKLVQIVLAGQLPIADTLHLPGCEQIRQRINVVAKLRPMDDREIREYMEHRLQVAGASIDLFTAEALDSIVRGSAGVPRNVNTICFSSLTLAFALHRRQVGREEVAEVLQDLDLTIATTFEIEHQREAVVAAATPAVTLAAEKPVFRESILRGTRLSGTKNSLRPAAIAASLLILAAGSYWLQSFIGGN